MKKFTTLLEKIKAIYITVIKYLKIGLKYAAKYTGLSYLKNKFMHLPNKYKKMVYGVMFILPWLIGLIYISFPIMLKSLRMAFSDKYYFVTGSGWVITGKWYELTQFKRIFQDEPYHVSQIIETLQDVAIVVPLVVVFALILALLLNQKIKGVGIFRTIFFIPVILLSGNMLMNFERNSLLTVPAIASGEISTFMSEYFPDLFNEVIISAFGKIVLILWLSGVQILIFLAGLQKMDKSIYEAARIDGASMWELFWKITLPALTPLIYLNIIYTTIIYSNLSNNAIVQIINVHSDESRMLAGTLVDQINYGRAYSAALSWILFFIELVVIGFYSLVIKLSSRKYD